MELRTVQVGPRHDNRELHQVQVAHEAGRVDLLGRELHVLSARGQHHGIEIVHAADQHGPLDRVGRQAALGPVGHQHAACQVPARRMAAEIDPVRVAAIARRILDGPGDRGSALLDHLGQSHLVDVVEAGRQVGRPPADQRRRRIRGIAERVEHPRAAVNEHEDRHSRSACPRCAGRRKNVDLLDVCLSIALGARRHLLADLGTRRAVVVLQRAKVRRPDGLVVGQIELRLGVV